MSIKELENTPEVGVTKAKKVRREQNVIALFTPGDNCHLNLTDYISGAKKIHGPLFNSCVEWDRSEWDIRGFESTDSARKISNRACIHFTRRNMQKAKVKISKGEMIPFSEPFSNFAKAFITYRHYAKKKTHENHGVSIAALRYLYEILLESGSPCVTRLIPAHFDEAIRIAMGQVATSTLYRHGVALAEISSTLTKKRLTEVPLHWESPISRNPDAGGASHNRGGKKAKAARAEKLPKTDALIFLAALWNNYDELEEKDKNLICMAVILMLCGFRMDEFAGLDIECIPTREDYEEQDFELDPQTGTYRKLLRIRALAKKKNHWDEKIVPPCAVDIIFLAVDRLKELCTPHRRTALMMMEEGKWDRFAKYDDEQLLGTGELKELFGFPNHSNVIATFERRGVERICIGPRKKAHFRVGDIHKAFSEEYKKHILPIVDGFGHDGLNVPIWKFLSLRYVDQYTAKERLNCFAIPLTSTQVGDFFGGRDYVSRISKKDSRVQSVFERYEFSELEQVKTTIRTHQFRHMLNTLMQESDMFSQEDIAKNFLRKNTQDNKAYNHQLQPKNYAERSVQLAKSVLAASSIDAAEAKDVIQKFPLLSHEELQKDLDESGSFHFMDIGRCRHDYTQGPCGMHYMCLRNCINYRRTKGDKDEVDKITDRRNRALAQMELARLDAEDDFVGANNWYLNHKELVDGSNTALAIEENDEYQDGDVVQVFPSGIDRCDEAE